jgi:tellurite methyltransferase
MIMKNVLTSLMIFGGSVAFVQAGEKEFINLDAHPEISREEFRREIYTDPNLVLAMYQVMKDVGEVLEAREVDHWLSFGSLLGAVRAQSPIRHDDDLDICVNKKDEQKLIELKDEFNTLGYDLFYDPTELVGYKIYSKTWISLANHPDKKVLPFIDLFLSELEGDKYVLSMPKAKDFFPNGWFYKDQVENKQRYQFGDLLVWGPSNVEEYLARRYGPEWKTIGLYYWVHHAEVKHKYVWKLTPEDLQPAQPTGPLENRVAKFLPYLLEKQGNEITLQTKDFWNRFYQEGSVRREPSTFCQFIQEQGFVSPASTMVDVGCGNARDTFYFLKSNIKAFGIDGSKSATESNIEFAKSLGMEEAPFATVDVTDTQSLMAYKDYDNVYARFFVHAINEKAQHQFLTFLSFLKEGAKVFLEFRTDKDPMFLRSQQISKNEGVTDHYRRFINLEEFVKLLPTYKLKIDYIHEAQGLSVRGDDNPYLARIVAHKDSNN